MIKNDLESLLPRVTIITVVRNGKNCIQETMNSVFLQDYQNIEYIVIDGCSNDGTFDILKSNQSQIDILISEKDQGIYFAMNKGIELSSGDLVGFLNASDILYPNTISKLASAYEQDHFDYSFGSAHIESEQGIRIALSSPLKVIPIKSNSYTGMPSPHLAVYMKLSFLRSLGMFDTQFGLSSDYDLLLRAIKRSRHFWIFDEPVGAFRLGGVSGSYRTYFENFLVMRKNNIQWAMRMYITARGLAGLFLRNNFPHRFHSSIKRFFK